MPKVKLVNVTKRYGEIIALDDISVEIDDGEYVCVVGPSGCGKSTFLKVIAGIVKPEKGEIYIDDVLVNDLPVRERRIGFVMQDILLFPHMIVWENVIYGPLVQTASYAKAEKIGSSVVQEMALTLRKSALPQELSRGVQQKVAIARAVISGANLLLLDEPLGSIDPRAAKMLRIELRDLVKDLKLTAIHVTHNQEEAMSIADKIVVMRKGRIEQYGTPGELYYKPANPFVARFIGGETNFFEGVVVSSGSLLEVDVEGLIFKLKNTGFRKGERVIVAIRPEHIKLSSTKTAGENVFSAKVKEVNFLGLTYRYLIEIDGLEFVVKQLRHAGVYKRNSEVYAVVRDAHIFKHPGLNIKEVISYE